ARDTHLDLVRGAQTAVAALEGHSHGGGVLYAVTAPGRAHAGLHHPQGLAVGVTGFEAGIDQAPPDLGQLVQAGAEHADALGAVELQVQAVVLGHLSQHEQLLGGDLAGRHPGDHRVGAVLLDVGHHVVVGVLQRSQLLADRAVQLPGGRAERGEDRCDHRPADRAAAPGAESGHDLGEGVLASVLDQLVQLSARHREVLAHGGGDRDAGALVLLVQELGQSRDAGAAHRAGRRALLDLADGGAAVLGDRAADGAGIDVVARAHHRVVRQLGVRERSAGTLASATPAAEGAITAQGSAPRSLPTSGRSAVYSAMSPTQTPHSSFFASPDITSLRYSWLTGSAKETSRAPGEMPLTSPNAAASP